MTTAQTVFDLCVHRRDVFAVQQTDGAYFPEYRELEVEDIEEHLAGFTSIGSYVIKPGDNTVTYVVFDLDTYDEAALRELKVLVTAAVTDLSKGFPPPCLILESSGGKGFHVWLFFDRPVPAAQVRQWVSAAILPKWKDEWPLEVFPKQDDVPEGGFGNLVKLPLGVHAVTGNRSEVLSGGVGQAWATSVDDVQPLPASLLPPLDASRAQPAPGAGTFAQRHDIPDTPFACINRILQEGAGKGFRDNAMYQLALYLHGHGIPQDMALDLAGRANEHFEPPLLDREVERKVNSAYRGRHAAASCGAGWLRDFCPGPCRAGWKVADPANHGELQRASEGDTVKVSVVQVRETADRRRVTVGHPDAENAPTLVTRKGTR